MCVCVCVCSSRPLLCAGTSFAARIVMYVCVCVCVCVFHSAGGGGLVPSPLITGGPLTLPPIATSSPIHSLPHTHKHTPSLRVDTGCSSVTARPTPPPATPRVPGQSPRMSRWLSTPHLSTVQRLQVRVCVLPGGESVYVRVGGAFVCVLAEIVCQGLCVSVSVCVCVSCVCWPRLCVCMCLCLCVHPR
ncbi:MAG: hypothetical protein P4L40_22735 [Terracidiphilus sp.]|nr:hypothetical protein [Terracidiphilus sp.]